MRTPPSLVLAGLLSSFCALPLGGAELQAGLDAYEHQDYESALRELRPLAEQGHPTAQAKLGTMYFYGSGVPKDDSAAVVWWQKAAEQGDAIAQYSLGYTYANGVGVERDDATADRWYRQAASQGFAQAQTVLRKRELERVLSTARQWALKEDMNGDGAVTISDLGAWFDWLFLYPGDLALRVVLQDEGLARFLEFTPDDFGGRLSGLVSGLFWFIVALVSWGILTVSRSEASEPSPFELFDRDEDGQRFEVISRPGGFIRPDVAEQKGHRFAEPPQVMRQFDDRQEAWDYACNAARASLRLVDPETRRTKSRRWIGVRKVARQDWVYWITSDEIVDWRKRRDSASESVALQ